jgi:hypothetical protein
MKQEGEKRKRVKNQGCKEMKKEGNKRNLSKIRKKE